MHHFINGIHYLGQGFHLITKPGLKRFVIIPLIINILLFISLFLLLRYLIGEFNAWFTHFLPAWLHWLSILLWVLFFLGFFVIIVYTFVTITNLLSAPFNSFLAEKVEMYLTHHNLTQRSLWDNIKDVPRVVGRQFAILGYYIPRAILILILFFIPVIHIIAPILAFLFHAWFMTFTYIDYPTDNHRIPIHKVRSWLHERRSLTLGFGVAVLLFSMVPILNFFIIPAAVAGATKCWIDEEKNKQNEQ